LPAPAPGPAALIQADALQLPLADESVDLIITSPPYFGLRSYTDQGEHYAGQLGSEPAPAEFLQALWAATAEMKRVLKPGGSIFVNLGDKYNSAASFQQGDQAAPSALKRGPSDRNGTSAVGRGSTVPAVPVKSLMLLPEAYQLGCTGMLAQLGGPDPGLNLIARAVICWSKPNGLPESVRDRVRRSHEDWVHLVKQPRYYSAIDEIRELTPDIGRKPKTAKAGPLTGSHGSTGHDGNGMRMTEVYNNPLGKLPGSVWTVATEPLRLPEYMILRHPGDMAPRWVRTRRDAWSLLRDGGIPPASAWPRNDTRGELRTAPDHYAAFPSEWCRRLILGFSPPGICTGCGEGRVPVMERERLGDFGPRVAGRNGQRQGNGPAGNGLNVQPLSILGYACACTPHTDHPGTGGSSGPSYARSIATVGYPDAGTNDNGRGQTSLQNRPKVGGWREYHLDGWTPPPARPAVVLDPFAGTGTTVMAARALGRYGAGVDLSADYLRLARWRVFEGPGVQKVRDRTWPPPPKRIRRIRPAQAAADDGVQLRLVL
jgi:SAM-dependent methyltransferase